MSGLKCTIWSYRAKLCGRKLFCGQISDNWSPILIRWSFQKPLCRRIKKTHVIITFLCLLLVLCLVYFMAVNATRGRLLIHMIYCIKVRSHRAKTREKSKIVFDVCRLFFNLFAFAWCQILQKGHQPLGSVHTWQQRLELYVSSEIACMAMGTIQYGIQTIVPGKSLMTSWPTIEYQ